MQKRLSSLPRWHIGVALLLVFSGVYLATYRGASISADELLLFSSSESLIRYGTLDIVSLYHERPVSEDTYFVIEPPWRASQHEPLHSILGAGLYALAYIVPSVGMLHTVWMQNIFVTVAILGVVYAIGRDLGYAVSLNLMVVGLLGVGSMLWPYSQTYFREPLLAFWTILACWFALRIAQHHSLGWWLALVGVVSLALLTKVAAVLMLPALVVLLIPAQMQRATWQRVLGISALFTVVVGILSLIISTYFPQFDRFNPRMYILRIQTDFSVNYITTVAGAYLISPGRSLWATSPILLLALPGAWFAWRQHHWRLAFAPFVLLLSVTLGYGLGGWDWHGGRGWGTRYILHVVPVMGLLLLPCLQHVAQTPSRRWWLLGIGSVSMFSLLVQMSGVFVPIEHYYREMQNLFGAETLPALYNEGTWSLHYTMWFRQLRALGTETPPLAWTALETPWGVFAGFGLMLVGGLVLARWRGRYVALSAMLVPVVFGITLLSLNGDPRVGANRTELATLREHLEAHTQSDDLVLLVDPTYRAYFLNHYRGAAPWATLPHPVGERYSPTAPPQAFAEAPEARLQYEIEYLLAYAARQYETIWIIERQGPFHPWAYRPVEAYLAQHFYAVGNWEYAADVRLLRFAALPAPSYDAPYNTSYISPQTPQAFGEHITLTGYDLPTHRAPGEVVPLSLEWLTVAPLAEDYNVSVQLLSADGALVISRDSVPGGGFHQTSTWAPGVPVADHHGLLLPAELPPGLYTLAVALYDWRTGERLEVADQPDNLVPLGSLNVN
ncbi:MAG: hypothetical protein ACLFTK_00200 [Anaerolineales bacterium]